jgi:putative peptide zinc metalloprotease protein
MKGNFFMNFEKRSLILSPDSKCLSLIVEKTKAYGQEIGFSDDLCEMISGSLVESSEELIRICEEKSIDKSFEICFDFQDNTAIVEIIYDAKIPLDPNETEEYKLPNQDIDDINIDVLWLHFIKKRMDRVFFEKKGSSKVLKMMKYNREQDKTRQFWVMSLSPKLKKSVTLQTQKVVDDEKLSRGSILQDHESGILLKLDAGSTFIVQRMDGVRTFYEIYMEYTAQIGMISPQKLALIFEKLEDSKMLEDKIEDKKKSFLKKLIHTIINPNFFMPHADFFVSFFYKCLRFLFNPAGLILLLVLGFSGIYSLVIDWSNYIEKIPKLGQFFINDPKMFFVVYLAMIIIMIIHEFGHGLMCKHYGGRVDRIGIMFYLAMFIFYCDTSAAWNFSKKYQRIMVSLAGPLVTFAILGVLLNCFTFVTMSYSLQMIVLVVIILSVYSLVMNFNPFIKMDAYYMLMDWTKIDNLRVKSFEYLKSCLYKLVFHKKKIQEEITIREKIIFLIYGFFGFIISAVFFLYPFYRFGKILLSKNKTIGIMFYGAVIIFIILIKLTRIAFSKVHSITHKKYKLT